MTETRYAVLIPLELLYRDDRDAAKGSLLHEVEQSEKLTSSRAIKKQKTCFAKLTIAFRSASQTSTGWGRDTFDQPLQLSFLQPLPASDSNTRAEGGWWQHPFHS